MIVLNNIKGVSLIAAIFIIVVLGFMGMMFVSLIGTGSLSSVNDLQSEQALSVAEGGMEYILENRAFPNYSTAGALVPLGAGNFRIDTPTYLTADPGAAGLTINVQSTATFPNAGRISIDSEVISYMGKNATQFNAGVVRGAGGTTASAHAAGNAVYPVTTVTDNPLPIGNTTINVASNVGFSIPGVIVIDSEYIFCADVNGTTQFTNCTRGYKSSPAAAHLLGSNVFQYIITSTGFVGSAQRAVTRSSTQNISIGAMMVYAKANGDPIPYYRRWDGTAWGAELQATTVGAGRTIQYMILRFARTRDKAVLGTLDSTGDIRVQVWDGNTNTWGAATLIGNTTAGYSIYRGFDIEYETSGDRAIIVYNDFSNGTSLAYNIWDGTAWSGANPIAVPFTTIAPGFQAFSGIAAAANGNADPTVTLPVHQINDILLLATIVRSGTATVSTPMGWTQIGGPTVRSGTATYQFFWKRAASASETNPLIDRTGTTGDVYAAVITYRGAITTGDPWEVKGTPQTSTADPMQLPGITTLSAGSLVVAAVAGENNNNASITTTGTDPAAYDEHYVESWTGADGVITFSEAARTPAGATGTVWVNWSNGNPVGSGGILLALKPAPITIPPVWIELARNPLAGSNEIAMILLDSNTEVYGMRWTGGAWSDMGDAAVWDTAASSSTTKAIHVAYEQQIGRAMFMWGRSSGGGVGNGHQYYRIWDGATLTLSGPVDLYIAAMGGVVNWARLASDPFSNGIMYSVQDSGRDLNTRYWNGAAWDTAASHLEHDAGTEDASRNYDIVFETFAANAGRLWILWGDGSRLSRRQWNGAAWGGRATTGDDTSFVQMVAHPASGAVLSGIYESRNAGWANRDIWESHLTQGSAIWSPRVMIWGGRTVAAPVMERLSLAVERRNDPLILLDWKEILP